MSASLSGRPASCNLEPHLSTIHGRRRPPSRPALAADEAPRFPAFPAFFLRPKQPPHVAVNQRRAYPDSAAPSAAKQKYTRPTIINRLSASLVWRQLIAFCLQQNVPLCKRIVSYQCKHFGTEWRVGWIFAAHLYEERSTVLQLKSLESRCLITDLNVIGLYQTLHCNYDTELVTIA